MERRLCAVGKFDSSRPIERRQRTCHANRSVAKVCHRLCLFPDGLHPSDCHAVQQGFGNDSRQEPPGEAFRRRMSRSAACWYGVKPSTEEIQHGVHDCITFYLTENVLCCSHILRQGALFQVSNEGCQFSVSSLSESEFSLRNGQASHNGFNGGTSHSSTAVACQRLFIGTLGARLCWKRGIG